VLASFYSIGSFLVKLDNYITYDEANELNKLVTQAKKKT